MAGVEREEEEGKRDWEEQRGMPVIRTPFSSFLCPAVRNVAYFRQKYFFLATFEVHTSSKKLNLDYYSFSWRPQGARSSTF